MKKSITIIIGILALLLIVFVYTKINQSTSSKKESFAFQDIATAIISYKNQHNSYPQKISDTDLYDSLKRNPDIDKILSGRQLTYIPNPKTKDKPILVYNGVYIKGEVLQNNTVTISPKH